MTHVLRQLDRILRGEATRPDVLRDQGIRFPVLGLSVLLVLLGALYGACMGVYAQTSSGSGARLQMLASAAKVPLLFFLTLLVTLPSLYVFNALLGSRLTFGPLVRLMLGAMAVTMSVLASIGPIVAFFSVSTTSYAFITLLNVAVFAVSGLLGLSFLKQTLHRLAVASMLPFAVPATDEAAGAAPPPMPASPLDRVDDGSMLGRHTRNVFTIWMLVFGLVGSQMAWILRPFIGSPDREFTWFREVGSNFFVAVWGLFASLFAGN